jgi:FKBP12-rapamycin complex-associated protein
MRSFADELFPVLIEILRDSLSLQKREVALWVLSQIVGNTGYVVEPYSKYPNLLEVLLNILKTEQQPSARREVIRVLGLLGALDPYKHKMNVTIGPLLGAEPPVSQGSEWKAKDEPTGDSTSEMLVSMAGSSLDDFYPAVAISALMRILKDPNLANHHTMVIQAVTLIFKSLSIKCVQFVPQIMPSFLSVIDVSSNREFMFQQLGVLLSLVRHHAQSYMDDIFKLINKYWEVTSPMQSTIIMLVEELAVALGGEFKIYLPQIIPQILKVCMQDNSPHRVVTLRLLNALQTFGSNLDGYLHLIVPPVVKLFESSDVPMNVRINALVTMDILTDYVDFTDFASRIIHPMARTLDSSSNELRAACMDTLSSLVLQLGQKYALFIPVISKVITKHRIQHQRYECLVTRTSAGERLLDDKDDPMFARQQTPMTGNLPDDTAAIEAATIKKLHANIMNLQKSWATASRVSKDDWTEWLRRLSVELLKESPSPSLRLCWALGAAYNPLARDLFNAAFVSCWAELPEQEQDELVRCLEQALRPQNIPEITQTILNLAEFMEHCDKGPLPLNSKLLGECASKCRAYAKALHYKEEEFHNGPTIETLESLISINNKLQQSEAASGVLDYAMKYHPTEMKMEESWYEKLHDWDDALAVYEKKMMTNPEKMDLALGRMRCLEALGEWGQLYHVAKERWPGAQQETRQAMARMAAAAAWGLGQWEDMDEYVCLIPRDTLDGAFYRAVMAIHQDHFLLAEKCIDTAREILDTELTAMAGESYNRAYGAMVTVQMLSEVEEIVEYKQNPDRREGIRQAWWERLQGCQANVEDWQRILKVRSLVVTPHEDMRTWIKYASLCRRSGRLNLSHNTLVLLLGTDPSRHPDQLIPTTYPSVTFSYIKHMWYSNQQEEAFGQLRHFVQHSLHPQSMQMTQLDENYRNDELQKLLARYSV